MSNVLYTSDWPEPSFNGHHFKFGAAFRTAYNSPIGPLSLDVNWNNFTRRVGLYMNIGYVF
jgi:outer membrane translocation and assembly module TamA